MAKHNIKSIFGSYVTRNKEFGDELREVYKIILEYSTRQEVKRPMNICIAAEPGYGKSFLIKQIANEINKKEPLKIEYREYHVPALQSTNDLIKIFQNIQSLNIEKKVPLFFFDEVDGQVNGRNILSNFLAPMWDGKFHNSENSFSLGKSIFVFAGSKLLPPPILADDIIKASNGEKINYDFFQSSWENSIEHYITLQSGSIEKLKDFIDRIDLMICIPPTHELMLDDETGNEQIDIACLLIKKHFKSVEKVEVAAIMAIVKLLSESVSKRNAERKIFCSKVPTDSSDFNYDMLPIRIVNKYKEEFQQKKFFNKYLHICIE
jgi:hypothetical protein